MPSLFAQQAAGFGGDLASAGLGLLLERHQDKRQLKQQGKLLDQQYNYDNMMAESNYQRSMRMWHDTNYSAQMDELKKAGLNPGLLYGMSGGGATTADAPTGNVGGAKAASESQIPAIVGLGIQTAQIGLLKAQKENIEADTANKLGDAANKPKVGANLDASTASLTQGIANQKAVERLTDIQADIAAVQSEVTGKTQNAQIAMYMTTLEQATAELSYMRKRNQLTDIELEYKQQQIRAQLANIAADTWLKGKEGQAAEQSVKESVNRVQMAIQENMRQWDKMSQTDRELRVKEYDSWINDNSFPKELRDIMNQILIVPKLGKK